MKLLVKNSVPLKSRLQNRYVEMEWASCNLQIIQELDDFQILNTVSNKMNFRSKIYEPRHAGEELWGRKQIGGKYTGLIGEMINSYADVALGDLYYTPYLLDLMDLSVPYNTECLTFLTPESLSDNSWKTLIMPFK